MICEYCGGEIKEKNNNCIYCGAPCKYHAVNRTDKNISTTQNITPDNNIPFYRKKDISPLKFAKEDTEDDDIFTSEESRKSRIAYIVMAIILGSLGIHNFYAGYTKRAVFQVLLTLLTGWTVATLVVLWIWIFIEIIIVNKDAKGVPFVL